MAQSRSPPAGNAYGGPRMRRHPGLRPPLLRIALPPSFTPLRLPLVLGLMLPEGRQRLGCPYLRLPIREILSTVVGQEEDHPARRFGSHLESLRVPRPAQVLE